MTGGFRCGGPAVQLLSTPPARFCQHRIHRLARHWISVTLHGMLSTVLHATNWSPCGQTSMPPGLCIHATTSAAGGAGIVQTAATQRWDSSMWSCEKYAVCVLCCGGGCVGVNVCVYVCVYIWVLASLYTCMYVYMWGGGGGVQRKREYKQN